MVWLQKRLIFACAIQLDAIRLVADPPRSLWVRMDLTHISWLNGRRRLGRLVVRTVREVMNTMESDMPCTAVSRSGR